MTPIERQLQVTMWQNAPAVQFRPVLSPDQAEALVAASETLCDGVAERCPPAAVGILRDTVTAALDFYLANFEQMQAGHPVIAPVVVHPPLQEAIDEVRQSMADYPVSVCDAVAVPDEVLMRLLLWIGVRKAQEWLDQEHGAAGIAELLGMMETMGC